jgi:hypothetical protein
MTRKTMPMKNPPHPGDFIRGEIQPQSQPLGYPSLVFWVSSLR